MTAAELLRSLDKAATAGPWRRVDNRSNHWGMRDVEGPGVGGHMLVGFTIATDVDAAKRARVEGDTNCITTTRNLLPELALMVDAVEVYRQMLTDGPASVARAAVFSMLDRLNAKAAELGGA